MLPTLIVFLRAASHFLPTVAEDMSLSSQSYASCCIPTSSSCKEKKKEREDREREGKREGESETERKEREGEKESKRETERERGGQRGGPEEEVPEDDVSAVAGREACQATA